jgi:hypothetical protein
VRHDERAAGASQGNSLRDPPQRLDHRLRAGGFPLLARWPALGAGALAVAERLKHFPPEFVPRHVAVAFIEPTVRVVCVRHTHVRLMVEPGLDYFPWAAASTCAAPAAAAVARCEEWIEEWNERPTH